MSKKPDRTEQEQRDWRIRDNNQHIDRKNNSKEREPVKIVTERGKKR